MKAREELEILEAVEVNPLLPVIQSSGVSAEKQNAIVETLGTFFNKAVEWDKTIESIVINDVSEIGKMKMAREGRLTLRSMRLEAKKIVEAKRGEIKYRMNNDVLEDKLWLKSYQMIEATFNNLETKLEEKERYAEIAEEQRREKLRAERSEKLSVYGTDCSLYNLGVMPKDQFDALIQMQENLKEQARKTEAERIAREKAETEEREKIRLENERLKAEAAKKELELAEERKRIEAEKKVLEAKAQKEIAERKKAEAELLAKKEAEEKLKRETEARIKVEQKAAKEADKKAKNAPDKEKLEVLISNIGTIEMPTCQSDEAKEIVKQVAGLLTKVKDFIQTKSATL